VYGAARPGANEADGQPTEAQRRLRNGLCDRVRVYVCSSKAQHRCHMVYIVSFRLNIGSYSYF